MTATEALDLALSHHRAGRLAEAEALYLQVLAQQPQDATVLHYLGILASQTERTDLAVEMLERAVALVPTEPVFHGNLGVALATRGQFDEAAAAYCRALALWPGYVAACCNLGSALENLGRFEEAAAAYRRTLELEPGHVTARVSFGNVLRDCGRPDDAEAEYRRALEINPTHVAALNNLGNLLKEGVQIAGAIECFRRAVKVNPGDAALHSNLVYSLLFDPATDAATMAQESARWSERHEAPFKGGVQPHPNIPNPDRRLRIGFVSPDFRDHVIGRNLIPLFAAHDATQFEIFCYSGGAQVDPQTRPDAMTERFRTMAEHWRDMRRRTDAFLAETIRADQIDILVDLTQHMPGNRLPVFARQPAPLQVSFAGYPDRTGLAALGHRITDRYLEPDPPLHAVGDEQIWRIDSFWCYDPCGVELPVHPPPCLQNEAVTFGCLNHFGKINTQVLDAWGRLLRQVPLSRLLMLSPIGSHRDRVVAFLAEKHRIEPERVNFVTGRPRAEYLALYHLLDVLLDPFPYNGHTTTLDALWMGVPVISLAGQTPVSRGGLSVLSNLGLADLVADNEEEYVRKAVALAEDSARRTGLRAELRKRMEDSLLMDGKHFTRQIEKVFRKMWREWCASRCRRE